MRSEFLVILLALLCCGGLAHASTEFSVEPSDLLEEDSMVDYPAGDMNEEEPSSDDENEDSDEDEDADEGDDKSILGYIKVRRGAPRKEWINKTTRVYPLNGSSKAAPASSGKNDSLKKKIAKVNAKTEAVLAKKKAVRNFGVARLLPFFSLFFFFPLIVGRQEKGHQEIPNQDEEDNCLQVQTIPLR